MIVCIRHPKYKGVGSPELSCKSCCGLFIAMIKLKNQQQPVENIKVNENEW